MPKLNQIELQELELNLKNDFRDISEYKGHPIDRGICNFNVEVAKNTLTLKFTGGVIYAKAARKHLRAILEIHSESKHISRHEATIIISEEAIKNLQIFYSNSQKIHPSLRLQVSNPSRSSSHAAKESTKLKGEKALRPAPKATSELVYPQVPNMAELQAALTKAHEQEEMRKLAKKAARKHVEETTRKQTDEATRKKNQEMTRKLAREAARKQAEKIINKQDQQLTCKHTEESAQDQKSQHQHAEESLCEQDHKSVNKQVEKVTYGQDPESSYKHTGETASQYHEKDKMEIKSTEQNRTPSKEQRTTSISEVKVNVSKLKEVLSHYQSLSFIGRNHCFFRMFGFDKYRSVEMRNLATLVKENESNTSLSFTENDIKTKLGKRIASIFEGVEPKKWEGTDHIGIELKNLFRPTF